MKTPAPPKSNPIRDSKNRVKLGVFAINGNGAAFTFHPDRFKCTWDANVRLAQKAEKLGFEKIIVSKYNLGGGRKGESRLNTKQFAIEVIEMSRVDELYQYLF